MTKQAVAHPMVKFQRKASKWIDAKVVKPGDSIWKLALLYGDEWTYWKQELLDFGFSMQDPLSEVVAVEAWDEE